MNARPGSAANVIWQAPSPNKANERHGTNFYWLGLCDDAFQLSNQDSCITRRYCTIL